MPPALSAIRTTDLSVFHAQGYEHPGAAATLAGHGIPGIDQDVEEHLGVLVRVAVDYRIIRHVDLDGNTLLFKAAFNNGKSPDDDGMNIECYLFLVGPESNF